MIRVTPGLSLSNRSRPAYRQSWVFDSPDVQRPSADDCRRRGPGLAVLRGMSTERVVANDRSYSRPGPGVRRVPIPEVLGCGGPRVATYRRICSDAVGLGYSSRWSAWIGGPFLDGRPGSEFGAALERRRQQCLEYYENWNIGLWVSRRERINRMMLYEYARLDSSASLFEIRQPDGGRPARSPVIDTGSDVGATARSAVRERGVRVGSGGTTPAPGTGVDSSGGGT